MGKNQDSGGKHTALSKTSNQNTSCSRMYQPLLFETREEWQFSDRLPSSGMMRGGIVYRHKKWARPIYESDGSVSVSGRMILPTPTTSEAKNTPCGPAQWNRNSSLNVQAAKLLGYTLQTIGKDRRLSPHFVEWMMGFPIGWLE